MATETCHTRNMPQQKYVIQNQTMSTDVRKKRENEEKIQ